MTYKSPCDNNMNCGYCFIEYDSHHAAVKAKRILESSYLIYWAQSFTVDELTLFVRNLNSDLENEAVEVKLFLESFFFNKPSLLIFFIETFLSVWKH